MPGREDAPKEVRKQGNLQENSCLARYSKIISRCLVQVFRNKFAIRSRTDFFDGGRMVFDGYSRSCLFHDGNRPSTDFPRWMFEKSFSIRMYMHPESPFQHPRGQIFCGNVTDVSRSRWTLNLALPSECRARIENRLYMILFLLFIRKWDPDYVVNFTWSRSCFVSICFALSWWMQFTFCVGCLWKMYLANYDFVVVVTVFQAIPYTPWYS